MKSLFRRPEPHQRAGFTLIELMAVILIIGILATFLLPRIPEIVDRAHVTACTKNMGAIYTGLQIHEEAFHDLPQESGAKFFASLIAKDMLENTEGSIRKMSCPAVKPSALPSLRGLEMKEWYSDLEHVDGGSSAYAGRDMKNFPLRRFPGSGTEPLVADDNDPELNHRTTTVVLYADGSVSTYEQAVLVEKGVLEKGEALVVGPDSQVEELRKLSLD